MDATTINPQDLFQGRVQFEIPPFQRPYVWNEEEQWAPLWQDIERVAEEVCSGDNGSGMTGHGRHFLGAVVCEAGPASTGGVVRHSVIDGQQRMTTLQVVLRAARIALEDKGYDEIAEALAELTENVSSRFRGKPEQLKLRPSQRDRDAFQSIVLGRELSSWSEHRLVKAYDFFTREIMSWLGDDEGTERRAQALATTLQERLILVSIDLTGEDDSQLIFETLNDRGTPLLKADLIKNWIFREGERLAADVDQWATSLWDDFDQDWWRTPISQGRLTRSRVDIFLQYWLVMATRAEVRAEDTFRIFCRMASPHMSSPESATDFLRSLRADADIFKSFAELSTATPEGRFYTRVVERLELSVTTPLFLWFLSSSSQIPATERAVGLAALESWAVRRMLLRLTTKDLNRFVVVLLKELVDVTPGEAGRLLERRLSEQSASTRLWPSDEEVMEDLMDAKIYGNVRRDRLRLIFRALETSLRAEGQMYEEVAVPDNLELEHVMPQAWRAHWDGDLSPDEAAVRDRLVQTIGNLTVITKHLNASLSNRPWLDADSAGLSEGGRSGVGKRSLLSDYSLLVLNKEIVDGYPHEWDETAIRERSRRLIERICGIWGGPLDGLRELDQNLVATYEGNGPWRKESVTALAKDCDGVAGDVLDRLADVSPAWWGSSEFATVGISSPHAALGGLSNKLKARYGGREVIMYAQRNGRWHWSVSPEFARLWIDARQSLR